MAKEFRVAHAEIRQEGLGQHGTLEFFRSALATSWVPGTRVTRYTRTWILSRRESENGLLTGEIGFVEEGELETVVFDDSEQVFRRGEASSGVVVPFVIDDANRVVTFPLTSGTVRPTTVTGNLEALLNAEGTYRWNIVPISYPMGFDEWRQSVSGVGRVNARLTYPNPNWTGRSELEKIMDGFRAEVVRIVASAEEGGSLDIESSWFQQTIDHARLGYGKATVSGTDRTTGTESNFTLTEKGGSVPAISRVPINDETKSKITTAQLREAQEKLLELEPNNRLALSPDEDDDDDRPS